MTDSTTDRESLEKILRKSLDDRKLSRGERKVLQATLEELQPDEQQTGWIRSLVFDIARNELISPHEVTVLDWIEDVVKVISQPRIEPPEPSPIDVYFSPEDPCPDVIIRQFRSTRQFADVCVFTITDNRIADAMIEAHRRGIQVRVISDDDKSTDLGSDIMRLSDAGIDIRIDRSHYHMHHKYAVFDRVRVLTGSYNWTRGAADQNEENFLIAPDPRLAQLYLNNFDQLWQQLSG